MNTDISIKYVNKTGRSDFEVVVFTKNFSANTPQTYYCAWLILRGQLTSVEFVYPVSTGVGASYEIPGQFFEVGPLYAKLGSTWKISQESRDSFLSYPALEEVQLFF